MAGISKRRRSSIKGRASAVGTLTAVILFMMVSTQIASGSGSNSLANVSVSESTTNTPGASGVQANPLPSDMDMSNIKVTEEQAIKKVRELFPILKYAELEGTDLIHGEFSYSTENIKPVWQIGWTYPIDNGISGFTIQVDAATGDLINSGNLSDLLKEPVYYPPKLSKQQALEVARQFIPKAVASMQSQTFQEFQLSNEKLLTPLFGPEIYYFSFQVNHEGVKAYGQTMLVTVSGYGNITSFQYFNHKAEYPSSKPKISLAEANKKWQQDLRLKLAYVPIDYQWNQVPDKWSLAYVPEAALTMLDAQTGQWTNVMNDRIDASQPNSFVPLKTTADPYEAHPVTAEEAIEAIVQFADIPEGYIVQSKERNKGSNGGHDTWDIRWNKDNTLYDARTALVDASTGQLLAFNVTGHDNTGVQAEAKSALSQDKAVQIADSLLLSVIPDGASYRRLDAVPSEAESKTGNVTLNYQLFYRDVMVRNYVVLVTLNSEGKLVELHSTPALESTMQLEALKAKFTSNDAKNMVLNATKMELSYLRSGGYTLMPSGEHVPETMTLAYSPVDLEYGEGFSRNVDAVSGNLISFYGKGLGKASKETPPKPTDIHNNWAREALQALIDHGVVSPDIDGKVYPNKAVTTGEFIRMVAKAVHPQIEEEYSSNGISEKLFADVDSKSPYYASVNHLIGLGWLKGNSGEKLHPEANLTREQLAEYLAMITSYDKLAAHLSKDASVTGLKDAKSFTNPGPAALALKLKLMSSKNGYFRPKGKATIADAAAALYRLAQIQGVLDQPLMNNSWRNPSAIMD